MGQVCSSKNRRNDDLPERSDSPGAPPPYDEAEKRSWFSTSTRTQTDLDKKNECPNLDLHPALRNQSSNSLKRFFQVGSDSHHPPSVPEHALDTPELSHLRSNNHNIIYPLALSGSDTHSLASNFPLIQASSIPQWRWNNVQCRTWISAVLIEYGGKDPEIAHDLAAGFKGFGPNLYMKEWRQWNSWLGPDGQAIFALLMETHSKEGAVPKEVEIAHYQRDESNGKEPK